MDGKAWLSASCEQQDFAFVEQIVRRQSMPISYIPRLSNMTSRCCQTMSDVDILHDFVQGRCCAIGIFDHSFGFGPWQRQAGMMCNVQLLQFARCCLPQCWNCCRSGVSMGFRYFELPPGICPPSFFNRNGYQVVAYRNLATRFRRSSEIVIDTCCC